MSRIFVGVSPVLSAIVVDKYIIIDYISAGNSFGLTIHFPFFFQLVG
jgi:hypothetical protein